jgi:cephalosporin hydroxylase
MAEDKILAFEKERDEWIRRIGDDKRMRQESVNWLSEVWKYKYAYHFSWMGRPIIQLPQDIIALQEIIWSVKPDLIIETGIAHGGSLIFHASILELIGSPGRVLGIDIDIRAHNREAIEKHPMFKRIDLIEGSSVDSKIADRVKAAAQGKKRVMVILDSNHTHEHVLRELELYAPLVTKGSYLVVLDTIVEDLPADTFPDRPWSPGNNPKTAVREYLKRTDRFVVDKATEDKLQITAAPEGYLRCVKD